MQWKDEYKIGISVVDSQHKQLFLTINELNDAITNGITHETFDNLVTRLEFYTIRHFQMEERYMAESAYPNLSEELDEHQYFIKRLAEIKTDFKQNNLSSDVTHSIQNELGQWLKDHVLGLDKDFWVYDTTWKNTGKMS